MTGTEPTPCIAFHGKPVTKTFFVQRAEMHQAADEIVKGQYWQNGKGCAVGCLVHSENHSQLAEQMGIPLQMAYLIDRLFEGMPNENAKQFPARFVAAIQVGSDLERVMDHYFLALLNDPEHGVLLSADDNTRPAIQTVIDLYTRQVSAYYPSADEWSAAYRAAESAYRAGYKAASAAYSAASAAESAYRAGYSDHFLWQAEMLIALLKADVA